MHRMFGLGMDMTRELEGIAEERYWGIGSDELSWHSGDADARIVMYTEEDEEEA